MKRANKLKSLQFLKEFAEQIPDDKYDQDNQALERPCGCAFYHASKQGKTVANNIISFGREFNLTSIESQYLFGTMHCSMVIAEQNDYYKCDNYDKKDLIDRIDYLIEKEKQKAQGNEQKGVT